MKLVLSSFVKNGKVSDVAREALVKALNLMEGRKISITIKEIKKQRSLSQNAYYWGVVIPPILSLFRMWGNKVDENQVHEFLKDECGLSQNIILADGQVKKISGSTADMRTMEFEEYLLKVRAWGDEWGIRIPLPNEEYAESGSGLLG